MKYSLQCLFITCIIKKRKKKNQLFKNILCFLIEYINYKVMNIKIPNFLNHQTGPAVNIMYLYI